MSNNQDFNLLNISTTHIEKARAQGYQGTEVMSQIQKIQYLDISPGRNPGDLIIMNCFAPLPGKLSLLISTDITNEELLPFFSEIQQLFNSLPPGDFKQNAKIFNDKEPFLTGIIFNKLRNIDDIDSMVHEAMPIFLK